MRINQPQLLLIHTICSAIHRLRIVLEINTIKTAIVHTNTIHLAALRIQQLSVRKYNTCPSLQPQIILKCATTQPQSNVVNKVLFSLHRAIDMNRESYMNFRLLFQSPLLRDWGRHCTIQLKHCSYCLPWVCVSVVTTCRAYSDSLPLPSPVARKPPELDELTPAQVLPCTISTIYSIT